MSLSIGIASTDMNSSVKDWTVWPDVSAEVERGIPKEDDAGNSYFVERRGAVLQCRTPAKDGVLVVVEGVLTRTIHEESDRMWATAMVLTDVTSITVRSEGASIDEMFKTIGLSTLAKSITQTYKQMAYANPQLWGETRALPSPGPAGLPEGHYAMWAQRYIDAVNENGRGYMPKLLAQWPGETRSNVLRAVQRAEDLGLFVRTPTKSGGVGSGHLTKKGESLMKKGSGQ